MCSWYISVTTRFSGISVWSKAQQLVFCLFAWSQYGSQCQSFKDDLHLSDLSGQIMKQIHLHLDFSDFFGGFPFENATSVESALICFFFFLLPIHDTPNPNPRVSRRNSNFHRWGQCKNPAFLQMPGSKHSIWSICFWRGVSSFPCSKYGTTAKHNK